MNNKPDISKDFTINDIHKIREFNAIERSRVGKKEYNKSLNKKVSDFLNIDIDDIKNKSSIVINKNNSKVL
jgi:hypothetical protein